MDTLPPSKGVLEGSGGAVQGESRWGGRLAVSAVSWGRVFPSLNGVVPSPWITKASRHASSIFITTFVLPRGLHGFPYPNGVPRTLRRKSNFTVKRFTRRTRFEDTTRYVLPVP